MCTMVSKTTAREHDEKPRRPRPSADRIVVAAEAIFAERGYGETSLRQLMSAAGVSTTAFYSRFDSKEAVLQAMVERLLVGLRETALASLAGTTSPKTIIKRAVPALVAVLAEHRALVATTLSEGMAITSIRDSLSSTYGGLVEIMSARLGGPRKERPALAWAFVGSLQIQIMRWAVFQDLSRVELETELSAVSLSLAKGMASGRKTSA
jgi:AcrR family transcriptional regulator